MHDTATLISLDATIRKHLLLLVCSAQETHFVVGIQSLIRIVIPVKEYLTTSTYTPFSNIQYNVLMIFNYVFIISDC